MQGRLSLQPALIDLLLSSAGKLPTLELYTTLRRTVEENKFVTEQSVDGMNLAVGAYLR